MNEPEFYPNATLGFRQWYLTLEGRDDEPPSLDSLMKHGPMRYSFQRSRYHWAAGEINHAACMRLKFGSRSFTEAHREIPAVGCSCGFYAYGRRDGSNTETTAHIIGGVMAGWGNVELHERGFRCSVAKILAFFAPDPDREYADYDGTAAQRLGALMGMCGENAIPILSPDALKDEEEVRQYAYERDLALLEEQLRPSRV